MDRDLDYILENAFFGYFLSEGFYEQGRYADACFGAYDAAYCFLKAYAVIRGHDPPHVNPFKTNLLELAVNIGVSDPEVLQELSRLTFIYVYFDYPELRIYGDLEFQEVIARKCLKAVKVIVQKLLKLKLPALP